jgi:hypothetical protein
LLYNKIGCLIKGHYVKVSVSQGSKKKNLLLGTAVSKSLNPSAVIAPSLKTPTEVIIMANHGRRVNVVVKAAWLTGYC